LSSCHVEESVTQYLTVRSVLQQLQIKYRTVLVLYYYHDLSVKEIAQMTQRSPGTMKSLLHRGRKRIARLLKERGAFSGNG
jgi:RNA polymerase sigma factor (sigma-70 family)